MKRGFYFISLWLLLGLTLHGQREPEVPLAIDSPDLTVDHRIGFGEFAFNDAYNSAAFLIHNQSTSVLKGRLSVEEIYFSRGEIARRGQLGSTEVEIGQGARKSVSLFHALSRGNSLVASFCDESGTILWQRYAFTEYVESRSARLHLWSVTPESTLLEAGPIPRGPIVLNSQNTYETRLGVRPIYEAKIPAWALPSDPRQLAFGDGIVLGFDALDRLTGAQESAIARYVALGGVLILPELAQAFEQSLWERSPFTVTSLEGREARIGLGRILRYPPTAMTHGQRAKNTWIYDTLDQTPNRFESIIAPAPDHRPYNLNFAFSKRAKESIKRCAWFAALFILTTGPIAWMLRNLPRRRFLWFLSSAIMIFGISAILLGFHLRHKKGSLWWTTVTEIAPQGGGLQTGVFEMESAGARYHQVHATDPKVHFTSHSHGWTAFAQPPSSGSIPVPLLPWKSRFVKSKSLVPNCLPITVDLAMSDPTTLRLAWTNPNDDFRVLAAQLLITSRQGRPIDAFNPRLSKNRAQRRSLILGWLYGSDRSNRDNSIEMTLGPANWLSVSDDSLGERRFSETLTESDFKIGAAVSDSLNKLCKSKAYAGLIVFQVDRSPGFDLDESKTSFISSEGLHYVVQALSEDMLPAHDTLFTNAPYPLAKPKNNSSSRRRRVIPQ